MLIQSLNCRNLSLKQRNFKYLLNLINRPISSEISLLIENHVKSSLERLPNAKIYEPFWYNVWEKTNQFSVDEKAVSPLDEKFSMVLPPPNVTGHALTVAIEDAIFRFQKLKNPTCNAIFVPGYDHAGIGMLSVIDKLSQAKFNRRIYDYSKEEFDKFTQEWKDERIKSIRDQLRMMGASLDFSKEKFTLDEQMAKSVREAFIRLYDKGLIYRANGIVNWCYNLNSTISDIEIEWIDVDGKQTIQFANNKMNFGVMYLISFKLENSNDEIQVSTTRPYTIPGDVAIAVNPNDSTYQHLIGKNVTNPFTSRLMPIIADQRVLIELGTGMVKITPACSPIDFQIAKTHNLNIVEIFDSKGNLKADDLKDEYKHLNGLNRFKLNDEILKILSDLNQLKGEKDHKSRIPICSKSGDLIEYRILPQWYLDVEKANQFIKEKLENNEIDIIPPNHKNTLLDWIKVEKQKPWCISRQINWGHQIPMFKFNLNDDEKWVAAESFKEAREKFKRFYGDKKILNVEQEQDVMDTWFSSSLIPFCYFGWPSIDTKEFQNYYPLSLMETGFDILKFWVHKMLISAYYLTDQLPFKKIFLHGMIVDANGKKMSKSLGNVLDPLDFINGSTLDELQNKLKQSQKDGYMTKEQLKLALKNQKQLFPKGLTSNSADGLRLFLYNLDPKYEVLRIDANCIRGNRNLINKIWQSTNFLFFIKQELENKQQINFSLVPKSIDRMQLKEIDKWILSCLHKFVIQSKDNYENYDLHSVYKNFTNFFINCFCDVYMELVKPSIYYETNQSIKLCRFGILRYCLNTVYSVIHPLTPFVSEELYQKLRFLDCQLYEKEYKYRSILQTTYPDEVYLKQFANDELENQIKILMDCVAKIRWMNNIAFSHKYKADKIHFKIQSTDDVILDFLDSFNEEIKYLSRNQNVEIDFNPPFILDDGINTEFLVGKSPILKVTDNIQVKVDCSDFDLAGIYKKTMIELIEKKASKITQ